MRSVFNIVRRDILMNKLKKLARSVGANLFGRYATNLS